MCPTDQFLIIEPIVSASQLAIMQCSLDDFEWTVMLQLLLTVDSFMVHAVSLNSFFNPPNNAVFNMAMTK